MCGGHRYGGGHGDGYGRHGGYGAGHGRRRPATYGDLSGSDDDFNDGDDMSGRSMMQGGGMRRLPRGRIPPGMMPPGGPQPGGTPPGPPIFVAHNGTNIRPRHGSLMPQALESYYINMTAILLAADPMFRSGMINQPEFESRALALPYPHQVNLQTLHLGVQERVQHNNGVLSRYFTGILGYDLLGDGGSHGGGADREAGRREMGERGPMHGTPESRGRRPGWERRGGPGGVRGGRSSNLAARADGMSGESQPTSDNLDRQIEPVSRAPPTEFRPGQGLNSHQPRRRDPREPPPYSCGG
ncbi:MAG: hypothetical protein M1836_004759 [Candelina mexicana]|nr:MAG: hypothetical protein M1836_004759 [Candelina mexicana]